MPHEPFPILVAYPHLAKFLAEPSPPGLYRSWVLDSGAYSASSSGRPIDLNRYIDDCLAVLASPAPPAVIFALDVIGDPEASARNWEAMRAAGVDAVPTFHHGSAWHYLDDLSRRSGRIAIGGLVGRIENKAPRLAPQRRLEFIGGCFARAWPRWFHAFGVTSRAVLDAFPLASCDSTTWYFGMCAFGTSLLTGKRTVDYSRLRGPGGARRIRAEIDAYLRLERATRLRFGRVLAAAGLGPFELRLAYDPSVSFAKFHRLASA